MFVTVILLTTVPGFTSSVFSVTRLWSISKLTRTTLRTPMSCNASSALFSSSLRYFRAYSSFEFAIESKSSSAGAFSTLPSSVTRLTWSFVNLAPPNVVIVPSTALICSSFNGSDTSSVTVASVGFCSFANISSFASRIITNDRFTKEY